MMACGHGGGRYQAALAYKAAAARQHAEAQLSEISRTTNPARQAVLASMVP